MEERQVYMQVPYFQVPNDIFDKDVYVMDGEKQRKLRTTEKLVYIYLCRCGNHGGMAFPSYNTISDKCGMSRRKAIDAVSILEKAGLLNKECRKKTNTENESNTYKVNVPSVSMTPPSANNAPPSEHIAPNKEPSIKNQLKKDNVYNVAFKQREYMLFNKVINKPYTELTEGEQYAKLFFYEYSNRYNVQHPSLKDEQMQRNIDFLYVNFDSDVIGEVILHYFDRVKNCDHNLNHFCTEGIMRNGLYNTGNY